MKSWFRLAVILLALSVANGAAEESAGTMKPGEMDTLRLRSMLKSPNRKKVLETIKKHGPAAIELLGDVCAATIDRKEENRRAAVEAIEALDPAFFVAIEPVLMDDNWLSRPRAINKLDPSKMNLLPAMPILWFRLQSAESSEETLAILWAIVRIAPGDQRVIDAVLSAAEHRLSKNYCGRWLELIPHLEMDQKATKRAVAILVMGLKSKNSEDRITAMECLSRIGADAKSSLPELKRYPGSGSQKERDAARLAIDAIEKALANPTPREE